MEGDQTDWIIFFRSTRDQKLAWGCPENAGPFHVEKEEEEYWERRDKGAIHRVERRGRES